MNSSFKTFLQQLNEAGDDQEVVPPSTDLNNEELPPENSEISAQQDIDPNQINGDQLDSPTNNMVVRRVKGAHLVYKRPNEDGSFEEMWLFPFDKNVDDMALRKAILAGTDIAPDSTSSPDGKQSYAVWTAGNAQVIQIKGLPN